MNQVDLAFLLLTALHSKHPPDRFGGRVQGSTSVGPLLLCYQAIGRVMTPELLKFYQQIDLFHLRTHFLLMKSRICKSCLHELLGTNLDCVT